MSQLPEQPIHRPIEPQPTAPPERHEPNIPPEFAPHTEPTIQPEPQQPFPQSPNESPGDPGRPPPLTF